MKLLGPEVGYTDLLDFEINEKIKADAAVQRFHPLRPSAAGWCSRRLAYALMEYREHAKYNKELITPSVYRLFELGHAVEFAALKTFQLLKVVQQKYKQQVLTFFPLERADKKLAREVVEGSCDFVLWSDKYKAVGDVKSKKDKWSHAFKTEWDEDLEKFSQMDSLVALSETAFYADNLEKFMEELGADDFLCDNLFQLNLYACSDFLSSRGVDHAFLYRYNKNDSRHMEIRFRPSKRLAEYIQKKFNAINIAVDKKDPSSVPRDFVLGSVRCAYCPYRDHCWAGEDALKAHWRSLPPKRWAKDLERLTHAKDLEPLFQRYEKHVGIEEKIEKLEKQILKLLAQEKVTKVKLPNSHVYEVRAYKSPKPHLKLKRGKL